MSDVTLAPRKKKKLKFGWTGLSAKDKDVLARSILLEETQPPSVVHTTIWLVVLLVSAFLIWAAITRFDERASAPGEILSIRGVTPIQHLEGGIVEEVFVQEGDQVGVGTPLLRMNQTVASTELQGLRARSAAYDLQIERLRALSLGRAPDFSAFEDSYPDLADDQRKIYETQTESAAAQLSVAESQVDARREELRGLQQQHATLMREVANRQEEYDIQKTLYDDGLATRTTYLQTERALIAVQGQEEGNLTAQARARAALAEAEGRVLSTKEALRNDALVRLGELSAARAEVLERIRQLADRFARTELSAPIAGIVVGLKVAPDRVVAPGDTLLEIVPQDDSVEARVRISPRDIGYIKSGQEALVKVDTYNFARLGGVKGEVIRISATSFDDEQGNPYFDATVKLEHSFVGRDPRANLLTPGMTLVADIKTGEKSLLEYLWRPVTNSLSDAFGER